MITDDEDLRDRMRQLVELNANLVRYVAAMHVELLVLRGEVSAVRAKQEGVPQAEIDAEVSKRVESTARVVDEANVARMLRDGYLREPPPTSPWWDRPEALPPDGPANPAAGEDRPS